MSHLPVRAPQAGTMPAPPARTLAAALALAVQAGKKRNMLVFPCLSTQLPGCCERRVATIMICKRWAMDVMRRRVPHSRSATHLLR